MALEIKRKFCIFRTSFYIKLTGLLEKIYKWSLNKARTSLKKGKELI